MGVFASIAGKSHVTIGRPTIPSSS